MKTLIAFLCLLTFKVVAQPTVSIEIISNVNGGYHPRLHVRGTLPGSNYVLIEATNLGQYYWDCSYWARVPFQGDCDPEVCWFTNQQMFFRVQQTP